MTVDDIEVACQITTWHYEALQNVSQAVTVTRATADRHELHELLVATLENEDSPFVHYGDDGSAQISLRRMGQQRRQFRDDLEALDKAITLLEREGEVTPVPGAKGRWFSTHGRE